MGSVEAMLGVVVLLTALNLYAVVFGPSALVSPRDADTPQVIDSLRRQSTQPALRVDDDTIESNTNTATLNERMNRLDESVQALSASIDVALKRRELRFRTADRPALRLWESAKPHGAPDIQKDIAAETYVDESFVYRAPPPLSAAVDAHLAQVHNECEARAHAQADVFVPGTKFVSRFQVGTMDFVLRGDAADEIERFADELHRLQHPVDCKSARLLLYPQNQDCGIGAELHWMQMALTAAYESNRTLVMREDQGWTFADPAFCGEKSFSCYFEPLSGCDVHNEFELNSLLHDYQAWPPTVTTANFSDPTLATQRVLHWKNNGDFKFSRHFPTRAQGREGRRNLFWWRSMLMRYQFRVRPYVQRLADDAKQRIGASPRQLAVHFRGGDKLYGNAYNRVETNVDANFEPLFDNLVRLAELCEFDRIFVSSREPQIIKALKERAAAAAASGNKKVVQFIWDNDELRYGNGFHTLDLLKKQLNTTEEALNAIKDALLLLDSDVFVGMMDSNFSRLIAELGAALRRFKANPVAATTTDWIILP